MDVDHLIHPKEKTYYLVSLVVSIIVYLLLTVSIIGIFYALLGAVAFIFIQGVFVGGVRNNGVLVTQRQFPELYETASSIAARMGLAQMPSIYIVQHGNILNALATKFFGRSFVVVYAEILEMAYEQGAAEVAFVIAHEMAHLRLGHLQKKTWLYPASLVPFLSQAYSRACEYSCDSIGKTLEPAGAAGGILALAAGRHLYRRIDPVEYAAQTGGEETFFMWLAEHLSTHPNLPKRLAALASPMTISQSPMAEITA